MTPERARIQVLHDSSKLLDPGTTALPKPSLPPVHLPPIQSFDLTPAPVQSFDLTPDTVQSFDSTPDIV